MRAKITDSVSPVKSRAEDLRKIFGFEGSDKDIYIGSDVDGRLSGVRILAVYILELADRVENVLSMRSPEPVHDLRIALRKIKILLTGKPYILTEEERSLMVSSLEDISSYAGEARDMDVLNFSLESYFGELPPDFKEGAGLLAGFLRRRGYAKRRDLKKYLRSGDFAKVYDEICGVLEKNAHKESEEKLEDIEEFARGRIVDRFAKILEFMDDNKNLSDENIHVFRILCKKLRYSAEIFGDFSGFKKIGKSVAKLKEMQDMLGFYNDLSVHGEILGSFSAKLSGQGLAALASVLTVIGAVKSELAEEIEKKYKSMRKKDKLFDIKKKTIKKYKTETPEKEEDNF